MSDQQLRMDVLEDSSAERVEEFKFEPIKGYPMLNWRGKRPFTSTQYYPAQLKEVHGESRDGWLNKIFWGDNLQVMSHLLKEYRGKIQLVYIDPPFDSKADYKKKVKLKNKTVYNDKSSFEEKQYTDIWSNDEYLQFIFERITLIREILSESGSLYLHCDHRKSHHLRIILDEVFGPGSFQSEIQWKCVASRSGNSSFSIVHNSILLYSKGGKGTYNPQYTPLDESYIKSHYNQVDENGRLFQWDNATAAGAGPARSFFGKLINPPSGRHWLWTQDKIDELEKAGKLGLTSKGTVRFKRYLDEALGKEVQSIWTDIAPVNSQAIEDTKYPTQKPQALLERIIQASSNPGDLVFDCFMGCGTTQAAAMKLGRRFIGADINLGAIQITTKRLLALAKELQIQSQQIEIQTDNSELDSYYIGFEVHNVNSYDIFRNPVEAKDLLTDALELNRLDQANLFDGEKDGRMWKLMPVNRITTKADLNELITGFDYKAFEKRQQEHPKSPVEKLTLVCMGHEPDIKAQLQKEVKPFEIDVEVVDILRDRSDLEFKRDSEAEITIEQGELLIQQFYPMNLLSKLSLQQENVKDWREMVESVMIDWNYDGAVLEPKTVDIPGKNELVKGSYPVPDDAGTIRIKITDLLSESLEMEVQYA